jgi:CofD-related protein of GAK system
MCPQVLNIKKLCHDACGMLWRLGLYPTPVQAPQWPASLADDDTRGGDPMTVTESLFFTDQPQPQSSSGQPWQALRLNLSREVVVPDRIKLARYAKMPELGPKVLFFSGGTALRDLSQALVHYTHNSIHLITSFDSGGSSAKLRQAFDMPAVGDIRYRLMALADKSLHGNPEIFTLFAYRLPKEGVREELIAELQTMIKGTHPLVAGVPHPLRRIIRNHLQLFFERMPQEFDLTGASIGNLILAAGYLENRQHLDPVIYIFTNLVRVMGVVRPITSRSLNLGAMLADGRVVIGQHLLTGKEVSPISARIEKLFLVNGDYLPVKCTIREKVRSVIRQADLICYPMGSFFSSVLANLLPRETGRTIKENRCPKVFIPNTGHDPELIGHDLVSQVEVLLRVLRKDDPLHVTVRDVLHYVILDTRDDRYEGGVDEERLRNLGVGVLRFPLVSAATTPHIDPELLLPVLLSLA